MDRDFHDPRPEGESVRIRNERYGVLAGGHGREDDIGVCDAKIRGEACHHRKPHTNILDTLSRCFLHPHPSHPTIYRMSSFQYRLTSPCPDLPPLQHSPRTNLLAPATLPRLRRRSRPPRLLPRAPLSRRRRRRHETPPQTPARRRHRLRRRVRQWWRVRLAVCRGRHRAGQGRAGVAAGRVVHVGGLYGVVDFVTEDAEGAC